MAGSFNAKLMEEKLKKGWTTSQFAEYLEIKEEEVNVLIKNSFNARGVRALIARLEQNDKRFEKQMQNLKKRKRVNYDNTKMQEEQSMQEEQNMQEEQKTETLTIEELLTKLGKEESLLRKDICKTERLHIDCANRRREIKELLIIKRDELQKIYEILQKTEDDVTRLVFEFNDQMDEMSSLNEQISEKREKLKEIEKQISSLRKVLIYVYDTGEIESENYQIDIPDSWNEKYCEIMEMESMEILTVKQVKQLAKVISFTEILKKQNLDFDITFDSDNLKSAYEELQCS